LAPEEVTGDVMTDLQGRRAIIQGMDTMGRYSRITARVPLSSLHKYSTALRSVSQGKASFSSHFLEYAPVPPNLQEEIIAEHKNLVAEEAHH
jgi:elongation factor G